MLKIESRQSLHIIELPHATIAINPQPFQRVLNGRIVTVSGPSGVGKTTCVNAALCSPDFEGVKKMTSRPLRGPDDQEIYTSKKSIAGYKERGEFLYWMSYARQDYLVPLQPLLHLLYMGTTIFIDTPTGAALALKQALPFLVTTVFMDVPQPDSTLPIRMRKRGCSEEEILKRMNDLPHVYATRDAFDIILLNPDSTDESCRLVLETLRTKL